MYLERGCVRTLHTVSGVNAFACSLFFRLNVSICNYIYALCMHSDQSDNFSIAHAIKFTSAHFACKNILRDREIVEQAEIDTSLNSFVTQNTHRLWSIPVHLSLFYAQM